MRKPLIISLALHLGVLFWAVAVFPSARAPDTPETTPLPVDIVSPSEFTRIKAGERDAKEKEPAAKKPEKTETKAEKTDKPERKSKTARVTAPENAPEPAEPAPKPKPEKKAEPAPVPAPVPKPRPRKVEKAPPENKQAVARPKPEPKPKAPSRNTKREDFDTDRIAALLNKAPAAAREKPAAARPEPKPKPEPARGRSTGRDLAMTVNELDALRAKISQCWNPPVGGLGADAIRVKLRLKLDRDGQLSSEPEVVNRQASPFFRAAADSAVRAVWMCQPYELPAEKYALWRDMILNFDPREMFGG